MIATGWWTLEATIDLTDADREHIARLIVEGYTEGRVAQESDATRATLVQTVEEATGALAEYDATH